MTQVRFREAEARDADRLRIFYESQEMPGLFPIRSSRAGDFFGLLRAQGLGRAFVAENGRGEVRGLGTLSTRTGYWRGNLARVGYLGDLRVAPDRGVVREWREKYFEVLRDEEQRGTQGFLTAVIDSNVRALRALSGRHSRGAGIHYRPVARYRMVNLVGKVHARANADEREALRVNLVEAASAPERVLQWMTARARSRPFGYPYAEGEWQHRREHWSGWARSPFGWVESSGGEILVTGALWSPAGLKSNHLVRAPWWYSFVRPFFGLPPVGQALRTPTMSAVEWASGLDSNKTGVAFGLLIEALAKEWRSRQPEPAHFISFADFEDWSVRSNVRSVWNQEIPMTLFEVSTAPEKGAAHGIPGFEMALV